MTLSSKADLDVSASDYAYDAKNRLATVSKNGIQVSYKYNGDNLLVERAENGKTTRYYYDDGAQIIAEADVYNGIPTLKANYIRGAQLEAIQYADASKAYVETNGHGDITELRNEQGVLLNQYKYDIWGNILSKEEKVHNPFRYSGELWDDTTGLQYLRARWYDPSTGRFINEDTFEGELTNLLSLNLYAYVVNNPLKYTDPTGHRHEEGSGWVGFPGNKYSASDPWKGWSGPVGSVINFLILDNVNTLRDKNSSALAQALAIAGLLPVGKVIQEGKLILTLSTKQGAIVSKEFKLTGDALKASKAACNCFTAGTKVQTDEEEKNIEDIEVGDKVLSKDENNPDGELAYKEVTALYRNQRDDIIKLQVGEQVIETTDNHPFWVEGKGWVFADELQVGDKLQKADGSNLTIDKVEFIKLDKPVTVYNFTVAEYHTYYVTNLDFWVHNTQCGVFSSINKDKRLVSAAEEMGKDATIQKEADELIAKFLEGNTNPGIGSKNLFGNINYLRGRNGARIFYRMNDGKMEILGKSNKNNEQKVINRITDLYK